jgi:diguanylate cyclase (GGDEF)-like protein
LTHAEADIAASGFADPVRARVNGSRRPDLLVAGIATLVFMVCIAIYFAIPQVEEGLVDHGAWVVIVVVVGFALSEASVFNVYFRREAIAFSLSEIPLAFSLAYLAPLPAVAARLIAAIPVLVLLRGNRSVKLMLNISILTLDTVAASLILRWFYEGWARSNTILLVGIIVSMALASFLTSIIISLAIACHEGAAFQRIGSEIVATWWLYPVSSVLGAMTLGLALVEPALASFAIFPTAAVWYVMRAFGEQNQELRDLNAVYGFAGRVGNTLDVDEIGDEAAAETQQLFRAAGAALVRFGPEQAVVHRSGRIDVQLPRSIDDRAWRQLIESGESVILGAAALDGYGIEHHVPAVLFSPVRDGADTFAVLIAAQDPTLADKFSDDDLPRVGSISEQLSVSLRRGMLHERLEWEARHDALTGLPSRTLFEWQVADVTKSPLSGVWGVMMLDLDRFKEVNDTLGHHAGDALLIEFSRRMAAILGPDDGFARLAGDEFAVLCHRDTHDEVVALAQDCVREGGRPVTLDGLEIVVTVSVGVAEIVEGDSEAIQPMRRADIAMYNAKWQRTGVEFYRDEIDRRTPARLSMLGDLRTAIENDQLTVVYQPKLHLGSGKIVGVEALVRWDHPTRGNVPPSEFVRVAEDTGLIKQLTDLVLVSGIRTLAEFRRVGIEIGLAVNLSTHDLFDSRLPERVRDYLASRDVDPASLTLEITESSLFVDAPRTRATIDGLYQVGLRLAVDDFGTGYSSLSYLRRLPVHELKIDQSFVARMLIDPQDEVIVRSTVDLGHNLGLVVVAEGVETFDVLDRLREIGCDVAQGYAISEPVLSCDIVEWLQNSGQRAWTSHDD